VPPVVKPAEAPLANRKRALRSGLHGDPGNACLRQFYGIGDFASQGGLAAVGQRGSRLLANPMLVAATAAIGLICFPALQPAWVFVR